MKGDIMEGFGKGADYFKYRRGTIDSIPMKLLLAEHGGIAYGVYMSVLDALMGYDNYEMVFDKVTKDRYFSLLGITFRISNEQIESYFLSMSSLGLINPDSYNNDIVKSDFLSEELSSLDKKREQDREYQKEKYQSKKGKQNLENSRNEKIRENPRIENLENSRNEKIREIRETTNFTNQDKPSENAVIMENEKILVTRKNENPRISESRKVSLDLVLLEEKEKEKEKEHQHENEIAVNQKMESPPEIPIAAAFLKKADFDFPSPAPTPPGEPIPDESPPQETPITQQEWAYDLLISFGLTEQRASSILNKFPFEYVEWKLSKIAREHKVNPKKKITSYIEIEFLKSLESADFEMNGVRDVEDE